MRVLNVTINLTFQASRLPEPNLVWHLRHTLSTTPDEKQILVFTRAMFPTPDCTSGLHEDTYLKCRLSGSTLPGIPSKGRIEKSIFLASFPGDSYTFSSVPLQEPALIRNSMNPLFPSKTEWFSSPGLLTVIYCQVLERWN